MLHCGPPGLLSVLHCGPFGLALGFLRIPCKYVKNFSFLH